MLHLAKEYVDDFYFIFVHVYLFKFGLLAVMPKNIIIDGVDGRGR